jgi:UDP-N-acetylglucosamine:LPS N-acetylglucosamine transferase
MSRLPRKRVIILYADTGAGHRSVAKAIHSALHMMTADGHVGASPILGRLAGTCTTECGIHNPLTHHPLGSLFDLYGPVTRHAQRLFTEAYNITNSARACGLVGEAGYRLLRKRLIKLVESGQPDLVVCVHSLLTRPMLKVLRYSRYNIPLFSVVTDLASIHQSWIVPDVDRCFVPTADVLDEMIRRGMQTERLRLSGLPVHPGLFPAPERAERETLRIAFRLRPELFTVLVMGGGEGVGGLADIAHSLAQSRLPVQLIVVAGHNPALFRTLSRQRHEWNIPHALFGFALNVPSLMRASDVIITKAGSVTIAEALACGLPIIVSNVIEGQESGNVKLLEQHGVGCFAPQADEIVEAVRRLCELDEAKMRDLRMSARQLSTPTASFEVARDILVTLETGTAGNSAPLVLEPMPV